MVGDTRLGIASHFSELKVATYLLGGNDIEKASGMDHHLVPVPGVNLIDGTSMIRFAHTEPNHRKRMEAQEILRIATKLLDEAISE